MNQKGLYKNGLPIILDELKNLLKWIADLDRQMVRIKILAKVIEYLSSASRILAEGSRIEK